jgi:hypothetical protein
MAWLVPVVLLGLPLLDTALSILRRMVARRAIFAPDSDHIHHRLAARFSQRTAVAVLYTAALLFAIAAISVNVLPAVEASSVLVIVGMLSLVGIYRLDYHKHPVSAPADVASEIGAADVSHHDGDGTMSSVPPELSAISERGTPRLSRHSGREAGKRETTVPTSVSRPRLETGHR